jgi:hypothetical protein
MAGRQLHSKKTSDSVSSDEFTQYGQACEFEDSSSPEFPESNKNLEQGELAGQVAEKTSDVVLDLGNEELQTISEEDVEIPLGQQVATTSGANRQISTRTVSDTSSTQIQGDILSAIWQAMKEKEKKDEERENRHEGYRLETKRKDEDRERRNEGIRLKDREERQKERAADILKTTALIAPRFTMYMILGVDFLREYRVTICLDEALFITRTSRGVTRHKFSSFLTGEVTECTEKGVREENIGITQVITADCKGVNIYPETFTDVISEDNTFLQKMKSWGIEVLILKAEA